MHPSRERLDAFGRGDVPEAEAATIEDHLAACPDCLEVLAGGSGDDALIGLVRAVGRSGSGSGEAGSRPFIPPDVPTGYEILEPIGRGGMGVVYKANQRALGRVVALKQIQAGLDADAQELARFRTEAEAAARLRHPNIVQVYDVGLRDGLPFFAMELIEGGSLAARLREGPLRAREAAKLVGLIARAIDHAHRAGVVHRDLKPGNILLAPDGTPKVADFGLAKRLDVESGQTHAGALLGTPSYMAPEQAGGEAVGPSADIHALGAIFYECLTGRTPFQGVTPLETLEQLRSCDPLPPGRLQPGVPRDAETICLKCLEKDPRRRYATAVALADDLVRFLRGEPIVARPVGAAERGIKWARRRPSQAALAGLSLAAAAAALIGLLAHQARLRVEVDRANRAAKDANEQRALALANYREARETIQRILTQLEDPKYGGMPLGTELRMAQIETALSFYDRILPPSADSLDPLVRYDTALALRQAAVLQVDLGRLEDAERNLRRSLGLLDTLSAGRPDHPGWLRERMTGWTALGAALRDRDPARAVEAVGTALSFARRLARVEHGSPLSQADLAWCEGNVGSMLLRAGRPGEAEACYLRAASLRRASSAERPDDVHLLIDLAGTLVSLGQVRGEGRPERAEPDFAEAVGILEAARRARPADLACVMALAELLIQWGNLAARVGRPDLALERLGRGLALADPAPGGRPAADRLRRAAMDLHGVRARLLDDLGRHAEAASDWERALALNNVPGDEAGYRRLLLFSLLRAGDHARGAAEIERITRPPADTRQPAGANLYDLARSYALACSAARRDEALPPEERARLSQAYALRALDGLRRCADSGLFRDPANRDRARQDRDLEPIRDRPEFARILDADPPPDRPGPPRDRP